VGPTKADKRQAQEFAKQVNGAIALGQYGVSKNEQVPRPCDAELHRWLTNYAPTMKPSYEESVRGLICNHLAPYFGNKDLRDIRETDLLSLTRIKLDAGLAPLTIRNALSVLRRVCYLAQREGHLERNPAARIGELMRRVDRRSATQADKAECWSREETAKLLGIAHEYEPRFAPLLSFLFSTGTRKGEALGLRWEDVDFERRTITIMRSITRGRIGTPKSGRKRRLAMSHRLASGLLDLLGTRRREALARGWSEVPAWVFCSREGTPLNGGNVSRVWQRVRRRAQAQGVRPLKLHSARHTWATEALRAGTSIRWVADQLGHADPALTLRVYAHAIPGDESDISFADFEVENASARLYTSPTISSGTEESANPLKSLAPPARLERATPGLGNRCSIHLSYGGAESRS